MITFNIRNLNKVEKFIRLLPKRLDKSLSKTNLRFMEAVEKDAKKFAPVDTGELKESIRLAPVRKGKNVKIWKIVVDAPHALFQETGFTPHFFFADETVNSSKLAPGKRYWVKKWTPFLEPALQKNLQLWKNHLNVAVNTAVRR